MTYAGGPGYIHIPNTVLSLMCEKGLTEEQIHVITENNPARKGRVCILDRCPTF